MLSVRVDENAGLMTVGKTPGRTQRRAFGDISNRKGTSLGGKQTIQKNSALTSSKKVLKTPAVIQQQRAMTAPQPLSPAEQPAGRTWKEQQAMMKEDDMELADLGLGDLKSDLQEYRRNLILQRKATRQEHRRRLETEYEADLQPFWEEYEKIPPPEEPPQDEQSYDMDVSWSDNDEASIDLLL